MGDPAGIGGELILKALDRLARSSIPVIIGDLSVLERLRSRLFQGRAPAFLPLHEGSSGCAEMVEASSMEDVRFGESDASCGKASYEYVLEALRLLFSGEVAAVVTCPINKKSMSAAGVPFIGHTELLSPLWRRSRLRHDDGRRSLQGVSRDDPCPPQGSAGAHNT